MIRSFDTRKSLFKDGGVNLSMSLAQLYDNDGESYGAITASAVQNASVVEISEQSYANGVWSGHVKGKEAGTAVIELSGVNTNGVYKRRFEVEVEA